MANVIGNVKYLYEYNTAERERDKRDKQSKDGQFAQHHTLEVCACVRMGKETLLHPCSRRVSDGNDLSPIYVEKEVK